MVVPTLLSVLLLFLTTCRSAEGHSSKPLKEFSLTSNLQQDQNVTEPSKANGPTDSQPPEEEKMKIIPIRGKLDLKSLEKRVGKKEVEKFKKQMQKAQRKKQSPKSTDVNYDASSGTELISSLKAKLTEFESPLVSKVNAKLTDLTTRWGNIPEDERKGLATAMTTISANIEKFGNAGTNPVVAVQGAINMIGAVAGLFGPTGQLISIGLSFISGILGLFGKGPKPKPVAEVVREQIDQALAKFRFETLIDKANALISVYERDLSYLEGPLSQSGPISVDDIKTASCRVQLNQGDLFLDELGVVIRKMFQNNYANETQRCLVACELYAQLAAFKDLVLTQMLTMSSGVLEGDAAGILSSQRTHRRIAKRVLEPLFNSDYGSKIMAYFDPEISKATDAYATEVLNIGKYDRSLAGMYCLSTPNPASPSQSKDLVWSTQHERYFVNGKPYTTLATRNNDNCYWKVVPHGNNLFSIVNKKGCDNNADHCGSILSFDVDGDNAWVNLESSDGLMWEIHGTEWKRIRTKWSCSGSDEWCNYELRAETREILQYTFWGQPPYIRRLHVGKVLPSDGKYYFVLNKKQ